MALLETLVVLAGPSIGRAILRAWIDDGDIAEEFTHSIFDLIRSKTNDILAQRRASRQFEAIGENIAVTLQPIFEADGVVVEEGSHIAIVHAVVETIGQANITASLLAELNFDPPALTRYLLKLHPQTMQSFSELETRLYHRILNECSTYIVDTARQLPSFTERTLSVILQRENKLIEMVGDLLNDVKEIRKISNQWSRNENAALFETEYLRTVVRKLDEMELFGVDVSTASRRHPLSVAYVTLSVERHWDDIGKKRILSVDSALSDSRFLLIRGLAGAGKTTLLKWVAVQAALHKFEGNLVEWNRLVPFFIRLRHFAGKPLPKPEDFSILLASTLANRAPQNWTHQQLKSGRAIVLIDGVDEIPLSQREEVRSWVTDLVTTYNLSRFIITSRPPAIEEGWLSSQQFDDAHLQPMQLNDVYKFVDQWHQAVASALVDREEKEATIPLANHLKQELKEDKGSLLNLAQSPLLCAIICALHRERNHKLPTDRAELYEACCQMLLDRRDRESNIKIDMYPEQLDYRQKKQLMQSFSYWLIQNGWTEVDIDDADIHFNKQLTQMIHKLQGVTGADIRRYFVERSGMLRLLTSQQITFTHRTFQEYFAAQEALDREDIGVLIQKADDYQWHEVILLATNLAKPKQINSLIRGISNRGRAITAMFSGDRRKLRFQMYILAAKCAKVAVNLEHNLMNEILKQLKTLIPPETPVEARSLAETSPLITELLHWKKIYDDKRSVACINVLKNIGGDLALKVIQSYSQDSHSRTLFSLLQAWEVFDEVTYAKQVLSKSTLRQTEYLQVTTVSMLVKIFNYFKLPNLCRLTVARCETNQDLSFLGTLVQLTVLNLYGGQGLDLTPLVQLINLTHLSLVSFNSVDLTTLALFPHLQHLTLRKLSTINLSPVSNLRKLKHLELDETSLHDLSNILDNLKELETLTLSGVSSDNVILIQRYTSAKIRII